MDQTLQIGWTEAEARSRKESFRKALRLVLLVEIVAALIALLVPSLFAVQEAYRLAEPAIRMWGIVLLHGAAVGLIAALEPVRHRFVTMIGIIFRAIAGVLYLFVGGYVTWFGVFELLAAIALFLLFHRLVIAEISSRT